MKVTKTLDTMKTNILNEMKSTQETITDIIKGSIRSEIKSKIKPDIKNDRDLSEEEESSDEEEFVEASFLGTMSPNCLNCSDYNSKSN